MDRLPKLMRDPTRPRGFAPRLIVLILALSAVAAVGVVGYRLLGFSWVEAVYVAFSALLTEGFETGRPLTPVGELFTVAISLLGVTVFLSALAVLGGVLLDWGGSPRIRRRRMQRTIDRLAGHHIVCSYGRVGRAIAAELAHQRVPLVVIEIRPELGPDLDAAGYPYLIGDSTSEAVLTAAGIERAAGLVCAADSDADNVYITLVARSLNPALSIVARASEDSAIERLRYAGAHRIVSPYTSSGRRMALLATHPEIVDFFDVARRSGAPIRLEELVVEPGSELIGRPLTELGASLRALLIRHADGTLQAHPEPHTRLAEGDAVILFGDPAP
jgi:voltage-gated potassium channel